MAADTSMQHRWRQFYGTHPLHLLAMLASFAIAAYAAYRVAVGPMPIRILIWFVAAAVAHDLVLFPLYALADRTLQGALPYRTSRTRPAAGVPVINYVRAPLILSGLLLLIFWPLIFARSKASYATASGLGEGGYLGRWLAVTAVLLLGSALAYALRLRRTHRVHADGHG